MSAPARGTGCTSESTTRTATRSVLATRSCVSIIVMTVVPSLRRALVARLRAGGCLRAWRPSGGQHAALQPVQLGCVAVEDLVALLVRPAGRQRVGVAGVPVRVARS